MDEVGSYASNKGKQRKGKLVKKLKDYVAFKKGRGIVMFLILTFSFMLLFVNFAEPFDTNNDGGGYIKVWIKTGIVWCGLLYFKTEILSVFNKLNKWTIFVFWILVCLMATLLIIRTRKLHYIKTILSDIVNIAMSNKFFAIVCILDIIIAFFTVPYNWDSMTYHLPRIVHWANNQSVMHYATNSIRQVASPPFHEIICLDIYLLSRNRDALLNLVQSISFLTNAWLVFEIAGKLKCSSKFCKVCSLLFLSMPIAFGESVTTQNDNLSCVFLLIFVYYILDLLHMDHIIGDGKDTYERVVIMSACVGYGYLTKPAVSMGMLMLAVVLLAICIIRRDSVIKLLKLLAVSAPVIVLIILPEVVKNISTFGALLSPITGERQLVGTLNPRYLFINGLKNFAFNLPTVYINNSDRLYADLVYKISELLKVDINAPSISEDGRVFGLGGAGNFGHDTAINSTILYVSIFCFIWCLCRKSLEMFKRFYTYIVMLLFVFFCAFVRWEPFVSRYMLSYLALFCPMAAVWLEDMSQNAKNIFVKNYSLPVVCWMGILGITMLAQYHGKIAFQEGMARSERYFRNNSGITKEYVNACSVIENLGCERVGLMLGEDTYSYPIMYMLKHDVKRIEHIAVSNETQKYEDLAYTPDCIISVGDLGDWTEFRNNYYERIYAGEALNVYREKLSGLSIGDQSRLL